MVERWDLIPDSRDGLVKSRPLQPAVIIYDVCVSSLPGCLVLDRPGDE
jgi:hypothetical protein